MASFSGRRVNVGVGLESTRGTSVTPVYFYPTLEAKLLDKTSSVMNESSYGTIIKDNEKTTTLVEGEASISGKAYTKGLYYFLALVFGQPPVSVDVSGDTDAKEHTFTLLNNNEHTSATLVLDEPNKTVNYSLAMLESLSINWTPNEYTKIEMSFKSKKSEDTTTSVAYLSDEHEFLPRHATLKLANDLAGLDSAPVLNDAKSVKITFNKKLSTNQGMGSNTYDSIYNTDFEATVSIEKPYSDRTYETMSLNDTVKSLRFELTDNTSLAGSTTPTSLKIDMSRVAVKGHEPKYGKSDISMESIEGVMLLDKTDFNQTIKATLVNKYTY